MDRWQDADDDIRARPNHAPGRVAREGLEGFVKSGSGGIGNANAQSFGKIEIVQSKREQKKAEATRLMPPPALTPGGSGPPAAAAGEQPPTQVVQGGTGPPKCPVPSWASEPPSGSRLLVYKDGLVIQEVALTKVVTVFGRVDQLADVVLDHPSISRQHATAAWDGGAGCWRVTDLGSTHGTFVGDKQLAKGEPVELQPGVELRFAASTRRYRLPPPGAKQQQQQQQPGGGVAGGNQQAEGGAAPRVQDSGMMPPPPPKRPRVSFADDAPEDGGGKDGGDGKVGRSKPPLETVIGFSDGRDFTARVGPQAARSQEGKFAAAVAITTVVVPSGLVRRNSGGAGTGPGAEAGGPLSPRGSGGLSSSGGSGELGRSPEVKPQLQAFVEKIRKEPPRAGSGGLYELLPPPGK